MMQSEQPAVETASVVAGVASDAQHAAPGAPRLALVKGEPLTDLPRDLYIPPDALEVFLEAFEGPLDLLLYLIKRQNLDILNIPIAEITRQYMEYIELMKDLRLELAAEYLVMAAMLAEIKSRMLLPQPAVEDAEEHDPRAELVRRLQEYERYKAAAEDLEALPRLGRDIFVADAEFEERQVTRAPPDITLQELLRAFHHVLSRAQMYSHHHVRQEPLSVRQRMSEVLLRLERDAFTAFTDLFSAAEGRLGVTVTFLALLELTRESLIDLVQAETCGQIHIRIAAGDHPSAAARSA